MKECTFLVQLSFKNHSKKQKNYLLSRIGDKFLIEYLILRLLKCGKTHEIIFSVPNDEDLSKVKNIIKKYKIKVIKGKNLYARYLSAFLYIKSRIIVRLNGESIFIDPKVIKRLVNKASSLKNWDSIIPKGFPDGIAPVILNSKIDIKKWSMSTKKEHPLYYIKNNPQLFKIETITAKKDEIAPHFDFRVINDVNLKLVKSFNNKFLSVLTKDLIKIEKEKENVKIIEYKTKLGSLNYHKNNSRKNILFLDHAYKIGGAELSLFDLLNNLKGSFKKYILLTRRDVFSELLISNGHEVFFANYDNNFKNNFNIKVIKKVISIINENNIGILYANTKRAINFANFIRQLIPVKVIPHIRDLEPLTDHQIGKMRLHNTPLIIVNSKAVKRYLKNIGISDKQSNVVYNGVNFEKYNYNYNSGVSFRHQNGIDENSFNIGFLGQLYEHKGTLDLLDSFSLVTSKIKNSVLSVAGGFITDDDLFQKILHQKTKELKISKKVKFLSFIDNVNDFLNSLNLLIVPSHTESFGRSIVEAMAVGIPVIATNIGGIPEIIKNNYNGILVPPKNPYEISKAVCRLYKDKKLRNNLAKNGLITVRRKFTIKKYSNKIQKIISST